MTTGPNLKRRRVLSEEEQERTLDELPAARSRRNRGGRQHRPITLVTPTNGEHGQLEPGTRVDRFIVLKRSIDIEGGFSYLAYDPATRGEVVLEVRSQEGVEPRYSEQLVSRARAIGKITHPNIVKIREAVVHHGLFVLAMEPLAGEPLSRWMRMLPRSWGAVLERFLHAGRGLAALHRAGLVHGAFSADEVMIQDGARVTLTGFFGAAWVEEVTTTAASEQATYCTQLHKVLYGSGSVPLGALPSHLAVILRKGMADDPAERWSDMEDLLLALEGCKPRDFL